MSTDTPDLAAALAVTRRLLDDWIPDTEARGWWHVGAGMQGPGEPMTDEERAWLATVEDGMGAVKVAVPDTPPVLADLLADLRDELVRLEPDENELPVGRDWAEALVRAAGLDMAPEVQ